MAGHTTAQMVTGGSLTDEAAFIARLIFQMPIWQQE